VSRRSTLLAVGVVLVAGAVAGAVVFLAGGSGKDAPTPAQYLARASAVCRVYARRLDKISPPDPGSTTAVAESVGRALPVLEQQAAAVRRIRPPKALTQKVRTFFARTDRSLAELRGVLDAAKRGDAKTMGPRLGDWIEASDAAREASHQVGYNCS
jgi:hypothetical protein